MRGNFGSLVLIFFIVLILFGTKRLREIGGDLGSAVKNFRKGMQEEVIAQSDDDKNK